MLTVTYPSQLSHGILFNNSVSRKQCVIVNINSSSSFTCVLYVIFSPQMLCVFLDHNSFFFCTDTYFIVCKCKYVDTFL